MERFVVSSRLLKAPRSVRACQEVLIRCAMDASLDLCPCLWCGCRCAVTMALCLLARSRFWCLLLCLLQRPNLEAAGVLNLVPGLTDRRLCFSDEEAMM
ncbi:hypothetical protein VFPFJ_09000 [Purpureocillium lilacinum]|uniref:Uncharacterized protein n=1 Tax=Purpureocillium lilacinum TaxID=33203 RepID=A0A179GDY4_PURLI|nr:hypothetical protein VFPFJ_09000 [Purpureocillium lilacinum]OAQ76046.1 hypothetical protein VFPBJ_08406 [Purpureocillium lilacinum]OAQ83197.1 hypothetical protein VFPFJ_09000 [Purpureocillium lilacinum]